MWKSSPSEEPASAPGRPEAVRAAQTAVTFRGPVLKTMDFQLFEDRLSEGERGKKG